MFVLLPIKSNGTVVCQKQRQESVVRVVARKSEELVKHVCSFNSAEVGIKSY